MTLGTTERTVETEASFLASPSPPAARDARDEQEQEQEQSAGTEPALQNCDLRSVLFSASPRLWELYAEDLLRVGLDDAWLLAASTDEDLEGAGVALPHHRVAIRRSANRASGKLPDIFETLGELVGGASASSPPLGRAHSRRSCGAKSDGGASSASFFSIFSGSEFCDVAPANLSRASLAPRAVEAQACRAVPEPKPAEVKVQAEACPVSPDPEAFEASSSRATSAPLELEASSGHSCGTGQLSPRLDALRLLGPKAGLDVKLHDREACTGNVERAQKTDVEPLMDEVFCERRAAKDGPQPRVRSELRGYRASMTSTPSQASSAMQRAHVGGRCPACNAAIPEGGLLDDTAMLQLASECSFPSEDPWQHRDRSFSSLSTKTKWPDWRPQSILENEDMRIVDDDGVSGYSNCLSNWCALPEKVLDGEQQDDVLECLCGRRNSSGI
mmetsp:Transcript_46279/g.100623  ORF Transcript_46279/g.100623 Transcript_46279/m.100623 type:complete len:445 (-) Transcript_46279:175-1509(-)